MKQKHNNTNERFRWSKSQVVESNTYVRMYMEVLNKTFKANERQTLYVISKFFTDGAAEVSNGRFSIADHYFKRGENLMRTETASGSPLLRNFLINVYNRSRSLYHYRLRQVNEAIALIEEVLKNNEFLEGLGFPFLVFDRVSQYHNLSRVYFSMEQRSRAFEIVTENVRFLMGGRSDLLGNTTLHTRLPADPQYQEMRHSLLSQLIFETAKPLLYSERELAIITAWENFFDNITANLPFYVAYNKQEEVLRDWLAVIARFIRHHDVDELRAASKTFDHKDFYNRLPFRLMSKLIALHAGEFLAASDPV
jgi:hypothetical protein